MAGRACSSLCFVILVYNFEVLNTEQLVRVRPYMLNSKTCHGCQLSELAQCIFIGTLCPDALAELEWDCVFPDMNDLVRQADQVHLDPALTRIVEGVVTKLIYLKVGVQFLVHALQQVQVELCRHPLLIVIGSVQDIEILFQIHSDQQATSLARLCNLLEEVFGGLAVEVADGRSRKIGNFP